MAADRQTSIRSEISDAVLLRWPGRSAGELFDMSEELFGHAIATFILPLPEKHDSFEALLDALMKSLADATLALYPSWLPEAAKLEGPGGAGQAAVQDIARRTASRSELFGPFLMRMATTAIAGRQNVAVNGMPLEVVARECRKLILLSYKVADVLIILPTPLTSAATALDAVQSAAVWMSEIARFKVWLAGPAVGRMQRITIAPKDLGHSVGLAARSYTAETEAQVPRVTPLSGQPNPLSDAEQRLEARLQTLAWSHGRTWNTTWQPSSLRNPIRVDLMWPAERCVVEIDGADHLAPHKYARDRLRDRDLQLAGFAVLRFTNNEVLQDLEQVISFLQNFLESRRLETRKGKQS
ncbi:MAG: DUF559 domain-containing protein [Pseudomonadota bacterium]